MPTSHCQRSVIIAGLLGLVGSLGFAAASSAQRLDDPGPNAREEDPGSIIDQPGDDEGLLFGEPQDGDGLFGQPLDFGDLGAEPEPPADEEAEKIVIALNNNSDVRSVLTMLAELAQKPIRPDIQVLTTKIMLVNTQPVTRREAFNLLTTTLFENGVAVIDRGSYLAVTPFMNVNKGDAPFLPPDEDVLGIDTIGLVAEKAYLVENGNAKNIRDVIGELLPTTEVKITVDEQSNTIIALSSIGLLQRIQRQINTLDVSTELILETFELRYADAEQIAQLIIDLYSASEEDENFQGNIFRQRGRQPQQQSSSVDITARIRVAFNKQRNSVSVLAEPRIISQIRKNIQEEWDQPVDTLQSVTRVYDLEHSDAVKMRDMLRSMFATAGDGQYQVVESDFFGGSRGVQRSRQGMSRSDEEGEKLHRLAGQFAFEADEDKNRLIVTALSPDYFAYIDDLIKTLDTASNVNTPTLYKLRYARSEQLAERLNAMFAEYGTLAEIEGTEEGLTERSQESPFSQGGGGAGTQTAEPEAERIGFWWQRGQPPTDERPISSLIGKMRIVPISDQNAILVMAPPEFRASIGDMIETLDQPRRQVLIAATIVDVSIDAALALGIRAGSSNSIFNDALPDNQFRFIGDISGTQNNLLPGLFDTSVLNVGIDLRMVLQALAERTAVSVLSNPRVFTSDNEEAFIFDGQDIPFIDNTQVTETGQTINSFDYRQVGLTLAVRPHVTDEGYIDLHVNVELSSITPGETLFGGFIVDRRETATKVTIRNQETVVISGIMRDQVSDIKRKVPLLGDIPIIGEFFRSTEKSHANSELVAFITPIIIEDPTTGAMISDRERELLRRAGYEPADFLEHGESGVPVEPRKMEGFWWQYLDVEEDERF